MNRPLFQSGFVRPLPAERSGADQQTESWEESLLLRFLLAAIPAADDVIGSRLVQDGEHHGRIPSLVRILAAFGRVGVVEAEVG